MFSLTLEEFETAWLEICEAWCALYRSERAAARRGPQSIDRAPRAA